MPWDRVHVFVVDERRLPIDDPETNWKLASDTFLAKLVERRRLTAQQLHPFRTERNEGTCAQYEQDLRAHGGRFDVALLSSGEDGHVAGLFPNHHSVIDAHDGFILMDDSPKTPPRRMSASRTLLARTPAGVLLFYGEGKRAALDAYRDPGVAWAQCPARLVDEMSRGWVFTDIAPDARLEGRT
jgi:6-phosphogluconolactonase